MFGNKKDRCIVEITIEFNIQAVSEWLKNGADFHNIPNIEKDWRNALTQKYVIDMLPIGNESNAYFHRNKAAISQNISGVDYLEKADEVISKHGIERIAWEWWRGGLSLSVDGHGKSGLVLLTPPLVEVMEMEKIGKISRHEKANNNPIEAMREEIEIQVACSFDESNKPSKYTKVWRGSASDRSLSYGNALAHVSFSTLNFEVQY